MRFAVLVGLAALAAVASATNSLDIDGNLPATLVIPDEDFVVTLKPTPAPTTLAEWQAYKYELDVTPPSSSTPTKLSGTVADGGKVTFNFRSAAGFTAHGSPAFTAVSLTMTGGKNIYTPYTPAQGWTPTLYDGKFDIKGSLPAGVSMKDGEFSVALNPMPAPPTLDDWKAYKYELDVTPPSPAKTVTLTGTVSAGGIVAFKFDSSADPFKSAGQKTFTDVTIKMTPTDPKSSIYKNTFVPYTAPSGWKPMLYDATTKFVTLFNGEQAALVDLTQDFKFKVCRSIDKKTCTDVQFAKVPSFWTESSTQGTFDLLKISSSIDKATSEVIIKPYSSFVTQVTGITKLYISTESTGAPEDSTVWTPQFVGGASIYDPYIVFNMADKTATKFCVGLKVDSHTKGKTFSIDVSTTGKSTPLKIDTSTGTENCVTITLTTAPTTAGQSTYPFEVTLSSSEKSEGLINMRDFAKNKIDLFAIDGADLKTLTGTLNSPKFVSNMDLSSRVNLTLTTKSDFKPYPPINDYEVLLQLKNDQGLLDYTAMTTASIEIDASKVVTKGNTGSQTFTAMYRVSAKTQDGNKVYIVQPAPLALTKESDAATTAVYVEPAQKDAMKITPMPDKCMVDFEISVAGRTPSLSTGDCYIFFKDNTNKTVDGVKVEKGAFTVNTNVTLNKPLDKAWCGFDIKMADNTNKTYMTYEKSLSTYSFYSYDKNPLTGLKVNNETRDKFNFTTSGHVKDCHGEYDGTVTAECTNDHFVKVIGNGRTWTLVDSYGNYSSSPASLNLTDMVQTTCGSAAIFPAALVIAAVSLLNIFK